MSKTKKIIIIVIFLLILLLGLALMVYPIISANYAKAHRSEYFMEYKEEVAEVDTSEIDAAWAAAEEHNKLLFEGKLNILDPKNNGYYDQLNIMSNDVMAYITIPKIGVTLPIFHGTSEEVLSSGAGHMPESSLPIGGENTHSVITAHSGMASEPMFSDLGVLEVGDIFQLNVLGKILTYEVYEIPEPVLPQYVNVIQIQKGEDLCTLITCTPFGINTHRLLIHGKRIPNPETDSLEAECTVMAEQVNDGSVWETNYKRALMVGGIIVLIALVLFLPIYLFRLYLITRPKGKYEK